MAVDNATICAGQAATLTANGAAAYVWNTGATTSAVSVSPSNTTTYTVTGTTAGCSNTAVATVTVNPLPVITLGPDIILLAGQDTVLSATGTGSVYLWSTGATTSTILVNAAGTYSVTVVNTGGCSATDAVQVSITTGTPSPEDDFTIIVAPNPTSGILHITCNGSATTSVKLVDNLGRILTTDNASVAAGVQRTLNLATLPPGMYYVWIAGKDLSRIVPIIKY